MPLGPGDKLGRYEIEQLLGRGGMGEVYRARDAKLGRSVAIKLVRPEKSFDADGGVVTDVARSLVKEARAAARLDHPHIVAIHDVHDAGGETFIVMELVSGAPLRKYVGDSSVSVTRKVRWLAELAEALAFTHAAGIVHRDVKPANVMVTADLEHVKLLDFGIAKSVSPSTDETATGKDAEAVTSTQTDGSSGTPAYMAPERLAGAGADERSDQFSWGVLAYELLAGSHPFRSGPYGEPPRPLAVASPGVPPGVAVAVHRALAPSPTDRFSSCADVSLALVAAPPSPSPSPSPSPPGHVPEASRGTASPTLGRLIVLGLGATLILAAVGALAAAVGAFVATRHEIPPTPDAAPPPPPPPSVALPVALRLDGLDVSAVLLADYGEESHRQRALASFEAARSKLLECLVSGGAESGNGVLVKLLVHADGTVESTGWATRDGRISPGALPHDTVFCVLHAIDALRVPPPTRGTRAWHEVGVWLTSSTSPQGGAARPALSTESDGAKTPATTDGAAASENLASGTRGGSLREQRVWKNLGDEMAGYLKQVNESCGTTIQGSYDVASYQGKLDEEDGFGVKATARSSCESLIKSVRDVCADDGRARVKARIRRIECRYGSVGQKPNVRLSGDTLSGQFDPEAGGFDLGQAAADFLRKSL